MIQFPFYAGSCENFQHYPAELLHNETNWRDKGEFATLDFGESTMTFDHWSYRDRNGDGGRKRRITDRGRTISTVLERLYRTNQ